MNVVAVHKQQTSNASIILSLHDLDHARAYSRLRPLATVC